jgi:hypothetical protein
MCIPRSATDPLCPAINRPAGTRVLLVYLSLFQKNTCMMLFSDRII